MPKNGYIDSTKWLYYLILKEKKITDISRTSVSLQMLNLSQNLAYFTKTRFSQKKNFDQNRISSLENSLFDLKIGMQALCNVSKKVTFAFAENENMQIANANNNFFMLIIFLSLVVLEL